MTAYDRAVDDVALAHMQMQIDAETDARWRRWLGVDAANEYERWSKAERATREALMAEIRGSVRSTNTYEHRDIVMPKWLVSEVQP